MTMKKLMRDACLPASAEIKAYDSHLLPKRTSFEPPQKKLLGGTGGEGIEMATWMLCAEKAQGMGY